MFLRSGVGKSSLINRFKKEDFESITKTTITTGFVTREQKFPKQHVSLKYNLWDTAGAEKYHSVLKGLYCDSSAILLVYSIDNKSSFDQLVNYWYAQVKEQCSKNCIIVVVANKIDLYEKEEVKGEEAKKFAANINALYYQTSAKTYDNVEKMFTSIGKQFLSLDTSISESRASQYPIALKDIEEETPSNKCC